MKRKCIYLLCLLVCLQWSATSRECVDLGGKLDCPNEQTREAKGKSLLWHAPQAWEMSAHVQGILSAS